MVAEGRWAEFSSLHGQHAEAVDDLLITSAPLIDLAGTIPDLSAG